MSTPVLPDPSLTAAFIDSYATLCRRAPVPSKTPELAAAVARITVENTPFPHGVIDNFLPADLYDAVRSQWPDRSALAAVDIPVKSTYVGTRITRLIDECSPSQLITAPQQPWNQLGAALRSPKLLRELAAVFSSPIEDNLRSHSSTSVSPGFRLYQCMDEGTSEALGAHVDALRKLLTIVIYIDLDGHLNADSTSRWGTSLYPPPTSTVGPVDFTPNADHDPVRQIGFASNRAFVMPNTSQSLHGVIGGQPGVRRRSLMCGFWAFGQEN